jgi:molecular chaperone DnaJ
MEVVIPRTENCDTCSGTGAKKGTKPENCSVCKGTGQQDFVQNTAFGRIVNRRVCSACNGQGKIIKEKCSSCNGAGKVKNRRKINIKVPAGVDEGAQIRVTGEGESGTKGGPSGDLYVVIRVKSHEFFEREGSDIFCEIPLTFTQAALGDEIEIPTLTDKVKLKIPAGTQTNTFFRLKGKGVPHLRGYGQGDQNVKVTIVTPTTMTDEQRELLKEFARLSGEHTHSQNQSIFERMKRAILGE